MGSSSDLRRLFQQWCRHLSDTGDIKAISTEFGAISSNLKRVNFCLDLLDKYPLEFEFVEVKKSNAEAEKWRQAGNDFFKNKKDNEAFQKYTKSIANSVNGSECLGLAFANRSAVLFRHGYYKECLSVSINLLIKYNI